MEKEQLSQRAVLELINHLGRVKQRTISEYFNYSIRTVRKKLRSLEDIGYIGFYRLDGELDKIYYTTREGKQTIMNSNWGIQTKEEIHGLARCDWISAKVNSGYKPIIKKYDEDDEVDIAGYTEDKQIVFVIDQGDIKATINTLIDKIKKNKEVELLVYQPEKYITKILNTIAIITDEERNQKYNKTREQGIQLDEELREKLQNRKGFFYVGQTIKEIEEDRAEFDGQEESKEIL